MMSAGRIAAAIELLEIIETARKRPADAVANDYFRMRRFIGSGDRRAVSERVWSVLRARRRLEWWLAGSPATARLLIAASLLTEGWALSGVTQTYSGGQYAAPALNAAEKAALAKIEGHTLDHPSMPDAVRLEVPDWILPLLVARFGPGTPWGLRIDGRRPVTSGPAFQTGLVEIQDEGSQLIAIMVDAHPGMRVVDWCAGAGGKTLAMAGRMRNRGQIVACDVSKARLEGAVPRLKRAGAHNVERHLVEPGDKWLKRRAGSFDRVLVDAPCTGTGTWRRNPDARLRLTETDLAELVPKQAMILDTAQSLVRKGGRLIYATCSLLAEENEAQVTGFLARHPDFSVVPLARAWPLETKVPCEGDFLSLTPARHGTDGFFAAVLERAP